MNKSMKMVLAAVCLAGGALSIYVFWPNDDRLEPGANIKPTASAADVVRFTATRNYTRLPLNEQMKYLQAWGMKSQEERAKVIAELATEPYILELSSANSMQTVQLQQARQFFALPKTMRDKVLDQMIDQEMAMIKHVQETTKMSNVPEEQLKSQRHNQKLRKLLIENTPAEVRVEIAAFVQAKNERMAERGIKQEG